MDQTGSDTPGSLMDTSAYGVLMAKSAPAKERHPDDLDTAEAGEEFQAEKKKKKKKQPIVVVVAPPPEGLKGVLRAEGTSGTGNSVVFDDSNLVNSIKESLFARGIYSRVDAPCYHTGFYQGDSIEKPDQATSKLQGTAPGTFLLFDDREQEEKEHLLLAYVSKEGNPELTEIQHDSDGCFLMLESNPGPHFQYVSELVEHYMTADSVPSSLLALYGEVAEVFATLRAGGGISFDAKVPELGEEQLRKQKGHHGPYTQLHSEAQRKAQVAAEMPWYKADLARAEAVALIEFEPTGSFVVRDNQDEEDRYILTVRAAALCCVCAACPPGAAFGLDYVFGCSPRCLILSWLCST